MEQRAREGRLRVPQVCLGLWDARQEDGAEPAGGAAAGGSDVSFEIKKMITLVEMLSR